MFEIKKFTLIIYIFSLSEHVQQVNKLNMSQLINFKFSAYFIGLNDKENKKNI